MPRRRPRRAMPRLLPSLLLALSLAGCKADPPKVAQAPVDILRSDTSATCGMSIWKAPGPRAEAYLRGRKTPVKFGSTRDLFSYALQPDNRHVVQALFVQDVARIDWAHPSNAAATFVDARTAYYVAWQPLIGSMGPTLASFARQSDARAFQARHGGAVLRFSQITEGLISVLGARCPAPGTPQAALAGDCRSVAPTGARP